VRLELHRKCDVGGTLLNSSADGFESAARAIAMSSTPRSETSDSSTGGEKKKKGGGGPPGGGPPRGPGFLGGGISGMSRVFNRKVVGYGCFFRLATANSNCLSVDLVKDHYFRRFCCFCCCLVATVSIFVRI